MPPLNVTFDTNALRIVQPEFYPRDNEDQRSHFATVYHAIKNGSILGFFSDTVITLEGIRNADRPNVFGETQLASSISHPAEDVTVISLTYSGPRTSACVFTRC